MSSSSLSAASQSHTLYIVQRPLEHAVLKAILSGIVKVGLMNKEATLHCGLRSIDHDDYRYDYHIDGDGPRNSMQYIKEPLANTVGVHNLDIPSIDQSGQRDRRGVTLPDPSERIGQINMSAQQILDEADRLLDEFNKLPKPKRSDDTFALGGGYHIKDQNCQHFAVYLTLRLLSRAKKSVEKDHLIQLVWGKIEAKDKYDRISREIQAIANTVDREASGDEGA